MKHIACEKFYKRAPPEKFKILKAQIWAFEGGKISKQG